MKLKVYRGRKVLSAAITSTNKRLTRKLSFLQSNLQKCCLATPSGPAWLDTQIHQLKPLHYNINVQSFLNYFNDKKLCFAFHECRALLSVTPLNGVSSFSSFLFKHIMPSPLWFAKGISKPDLFLLQSITSCVHLRRTQLFLLSSLAVQYH